MSVNESALTEMFDEPDEDVLDENYPTTFTEKASYAEFVLLTALESLSPTLRRISRFRGLLQVARNGDEDGLPDIITKNEARMVLEYLVRVKGGVDEAYREIGMIYEDTKGVGVHGVQSN